MGEKYEYLYSSNQKSAQPILVPAAIDAVKQWRYRLFQLNGVPVEVETVITITFRISS
jgi:protein TonB